MAEKTILVLGATGKTGRRVVARLRAAGEQVRAASRSAEVRFDWADRATWPAALSGVAAVYLVVPEEAGPVEPFVEQAVDAGVRRFVLLSGRSADTYGASFGQSMTAGERAVRNSGAEWTIMRPNNFSQNFDEDLFHAPVRAGRLALPIGDVPEPFIDVDDVADVAAALLTEDGHDGRIYELSGPRALTFAEAVESIAAASGREIRFVELTQQEYQAELAAEGVPSEAAHAVLTMFALLRQGLYSAPADDVQRVLGRAPRDFDGYAAATAATGAWD